jgi:Zn-dependent protease/CBS domain-containing protein
MARIARVGGIPIELDASWLAIFAFLTLSLADGVLPAALPDRPALTYWIVGTVTSLAFFASIVLHELGHSWIARRNGIAIAGIRLFVFGGVARLVREPDSPGVEIRMALAGPFTSLAVAGGSAALAVAAGNVAVVAAPAWWLARVNLGIAAFNLLPGFPLDGGRVMRGVVWRITGDLARATRAAAGTGQGLAFAIIVLGLALLLAGQIAAGVWLALIGWFMHGAAGRQRTETSVNAMLRGVRIADVMSADVPWIDADATLLRAANDEVRRAGHRCMLVGAGGRLEALLSVSDLRRVPAARWEAVRVREIATAGPSIVTATPEDTALAVLGRMEEAHVTQVPVVDGTRVVGLVGRSQLLDYLRTRVELEA